MASRWAMATASMSERRQALAALAASRSGSGEGRGWKRAVLIVLCLLLATGFAAWALGFFSKPRELVALARLVDDEITKLNQAARTGTPVDAAAGVGAVLDETKTVHLDAGKARRLLQVVWTRCVLDLVVAQTPEVAAFSAPEQDRRRAAFAAADTSQVAAGRLRVQRAWAEWVNDTRNQHPDQERLVAREAAKRSRHKALRELFEEAPDLLKALRPCWTMSPLVVSQLLPAVAGIFDVGGSCLVSPATTARRARRPPRPRRT